MTNDQPEFPEAFWNRMIADLEVDAPHGINIPHDEPEHRMLFYCGMTCGAACMKELVTKNYPPHDAADYYDFIKQSVKDAVRRLKGKMNRRN